MYTVPYPNATPRLTGPQQKIVVPSLWSYRQRRRPVRALSANRWLYAVVTYITPLYTTGVFSNDATIPV